MDVRDLLATLGHEYNYPHFRPMLRDIEPSTFFNSEECNKCALGTKFVFFLHFHSFLLLTSGI